MALVGKHQAFVEAYLATVDGELSKEDQQAILATETTYFCSDEYNTNECARLVSIGQKRATCSVKEAYEIEQEPLPQVGQYELVLDWDKNPVCITRITDVSFAPFGQVSREFAESEGEGDGSYEWWYQAHLDYFTKDCREAYDMAFTQETELVLVTFELVYPK